MDGVNSRDSKAEQMVQRLKAKSVRVYLNKIGDMVTSYEILTLAMLYLVKIKWRGYVSFRASNKS